MRRVDRPDRNRGQGALGRDVVAAQGLLAERHPRDDRVPRHRGRRRPACEAQTGAQGAGGAHQEDVGGATGWSAPPGVERGRHSAVDDVVCSLRLVCRNVRNYTGGWVRQTSVSSCRFSVSVRLSSVVPPGDRLCGRGTIDAVL